MRSDRKSLMLYAVTDRTWLEGESLLSRTENALKGGVTFVQLREKGTERDEFLALAAELKELCGKYKAPFVINDDISVALDVNADGVHVGQSDMAVAKARELLGEERIIGASAQTVEAALKAEAEGADYLGVGAVFPTGTKADADNVSLETLREICAAVKIPVVAIGGITADNAGSLAGSGIAGIAVVSAIFGRRDAEAAAAELLIAARRATG